MKTVLFSFLLAIFIPPLYCQSKKERKLQKLKFCGYWYRDSAKINQHFGPQLAFCNINNKDTIVDIGSSSGAYIGAYNVIAPFQNAHFILVDIDTSCLNQTKVANMIAHYEGLKGSPFTNTISLVNNTPDSLYLPMNKFQKVLFFNTLHEIDDKKSIAAQIAAIIKKGGELIIAEIAPTENKTIHGGCKKPLTGENEIINLFAPFGFKLTDKANLQVNIKKRDKHPYMFFRLVKN